ncbi:MAG: M18 family aminopeptidase [Lachnospiraceae bacterium]|nr:M18 family aminopeptidase [Lachnospiraceae bacterium]
MGREYLEAKECLTFIDKAVSCYHVVKNIETMLKEQGFSELKETEEYVVLKGGKYYIKRNDSSVIAFCVPEEETKGFHIVASHSDSPTFKVKAEAEQKVEDAYVKLNVEPYGGAIYATWLDRTLSVAGRIVCREKDALVSKTVDVDEDLLVIPNLAIHMNREMNKQLSYNPQVDLQPLMYAGSGENILMKKVAEYAEVKEEDILGKDLFLYVREKGKLAGAEKEMMISPRLDDQECVYASVKGLLASVPGQYISICAVFDNEEVGSLTRQGASSTFLKDTLERVREALGISRIDYLRMLANSFMISADNAHALHPNHPEKADPTNRPCLNKGIVIKYHGGQKYTTDAYTEAVMKKLCEEADVPYQTYCNRSDMPGGSTLGNISESQVSIPCVDIGLPQLAMHSAVECAGSKDLEDLIKIACAFFAK